MRSKKNIPSFDELDADQLKELIQTSKAGKKSKKKTQKLPLKEEASKTGQKTDELEAFL